MQCISLTDMVCNVMVFYSFMHSTFSVSGASKLLWEVYPWAPPSKCREGVHLVSEMDARNTLRPMSTPPIIFAQIEALECERNCMCDNF